MKEDITLTRDLEQEADPDHAAIDTTTMVYTIEAAAATGTDHHIAIKLIAMHSPTYNNVLNNC